MKKVLIVGAGFSGLSLARECLKKGLAVEVHEKEARTGGLIGTIRTPSGLVEKAAPSLNRTLRVERLIDELGLAKLEPAKESKRRLFFVGKPITRPLSVSEIAAAAFRYLKAKLSGRVKPLSGETVQAWGERVLGKPAVDRLLAPGLQGIYAGDVHTLSASLILGGMFKKDREKFNGVLGLRGGTQELIDALEADVKKRGGTVVTNSTIQTKSLAKPAVLAIPPWDAAELVGAELATKLKAIHSAPLISVTARFEKPVAEKAFGCLVPRGRGLRVLGVLLNDAIFPGRDAVPGETWIYGGATDTEILKLSDDELKDLLIAERRLLFGVDGKLGSCAIVRWEKGLPQYDLVLEKTLASLTEPEGIYFHGNWLGGIGLSKILERSEKLAERISKDLA